MSMLWLLFVGLSTELYLTIFLPVIKATNRQSDTRGKGCPHGFLHAACC